MKTTSQVPKKEQFKRKLFALLVRVFQSKYLYINMDTTQHYSQL